MKHHGTLGKQLRKARARVSQLFDQRRNIPKRVEIRDLNEQAVAKLATERKHLTDIIKMVAYQAESDLIALLRPHYARALMPGIVPQPPAASLVDYPLDIMCSPT